MLFLLLFFRYHSAQKNVIAIAFFFSPAGIARRRLRENRVPPFEGGQGSSALRTLGIQVPSTFQMNNNNNTGNIRVDETKVFPEET